MIEDELLREVRAAREAFAASHGFDIPRIVAALHEVGIASGREVVCFAPRPPLKAANQALQPIEAAPGVETPSPGAVSAAEPDRS